MIFIITAGLSYRAVENSHFRELLEFVSNAGASFAYPSRRTMKNLAKKNVTKKKEEVKEVLEPIEDVTITADAWTSTKQKMGFVAVTVHYFTKGMILKSISLGVKRIYGSHTGDLLAGAIKGICEEFNIFKKIRTMTGDNGANMRDAAKVLKIPYISCFAHVLNRVIVTSLKNLNLSDENGNCEALIDKCRKLVGTFNHSTQLTEKLIEDQRKANQAEENKSRIRCLRLIQDVVTRWNSLYLMLNRIITLKEVIRRVLNLKVGYMFMC